MGKERVIVGFASFILGYLLSSVYVPRTVYGAVAPLLEESFETDEDGNGIADGCTAVGNPKIRVKYSLDTAAKVGQKSQKLEVTESSVSEQTGIVLECFNVKAMQTYKVSFWYKTANLDSADVLVFMSWYDKEEKKFKNFMLVNARETQSNEWKLITQIFKPVRDASVGIHLRLCIKKTGGKGTIWFDGLKVE